MDWEKQDNELRGMMEGSDFLPDGEVWNAQEGWKKIQHKKKPERRKIILFWVRLAAAACVIGLLAGGYWFYQTSGDDIKPGEEVVRKYINQLREPEKNLQRILQPGPKNLPGHTNDMGEVVQTISESEITGNIKSLKKQHYKQPVKNESSNLVDQKDPINSVEVVLTISEPKKQSDPILAVGLSEVAQDQSLEVVVAPAKKSKTRVLHYNQLSGMQSTSPPVFVQAKKSYSEWEGLAMQVVSNPKEPPFQLKIDLSPAPKKSL